MSIFLEATVEGNDGCELGVGGADPALGGWDPAKALRFTRGRASDNERDCSSWRCEVPLPTGGNEFKLVSFASNGSAEWEQLDGNRRWPTTGLGVGATLRLRYGETRMTIQASVEQIQANARASRRLEDRIGSALEDDLKSKGANAYYYAHDRKFEVPEDAKVVTGPGLVTGGAPTLMEAGSTSVDAAADERIVWLKGYSWSDTTKKVKVYVPVSEGVLPAEDADQLVNAQYASSRVELTINTAPRYRLTIEKLNAEINADSCSVRVEAHKNRIVLLLAKKRETAWYNLTKTTK